MKVYSILHAFEVECNSLKTKTRNFFRYQTTNYLKIEFLFLVHTKGPKSDNSQIKTKFIGLNLQLFSYINVPKIAGKILTTQCSFTDHLKHKTVHKTTCSRMSSANSRQL